MRRHSCASVSETKGPSSQEHFHDRYSKQNLLDSGSNNHHNGVLDGLSHYASVFIVIIMYLNISIAAIHVHFSIVVQINI